MMAAINNLDEIAEELADELIRLAGLIDNYL